MRSTGSTQVNLLQAAVLSKLPEATLDARNSEQVAVALSIDFATTEILAAAIQLILWCSRRNVFGINTCCRLRSLVTNDVGLLCAKS